VIDATEYWFLQCPARATNTLLDVVKWGDNNDGTEKTKHGRALRIGECGCMGGVHMCGTIQSKLEHQEKLTEKVSHSKSLLLESKPRAFPVIT